MIYDTKTERLLTDHLQIHMLELKKFKFKNNNLPKDLNYWLGFFTTKNMEEYMSEIVKEKPIMEEAVRALQKHAFLDLGCSAMWCGYYDGNEKSKRCQEKSGFKYHHTEENKPCALMGDVRTEHFTYLTKEQWSDTQDKVNFMEV